MVDAQETDSWVSYTASTNPRPANPPVAVLTANVDRDVHDWSLALVGTRVDEQAARREALEALTSGRLPGDPGGQDRATRSMAIRARWRGRPASPLIVKGYVNQDGSVYWRYEDAGPPRGEVTDGMSWLIRAGNMVVAALLEHLARAAE